MGRKRSLAPHLVLSCSGVACLRVDLALTEYLSLQMGTVQLLTSCGQRSHHWYDYGVSESPGTEKLSATVPRGLAAQIRERAGRGNVSAYVTHALLRQLERDRLGDLVAELEQVHGPVSDDEVAAARSEWP